VVVDDGSRPEARELLYRRTFGELRVIAQPRLGVTAAWNIGAKSACTPFVVFLNNDVLVDGPWVNQLVEPLLTKEAILSGIAMRRESQLPRSILRRLPTSEFLEGWCFAVSLDSFHEIEGFDEAMFAYWSDTDFQARLLRQHGSSATTIACFPGLPLRHLRHRTAHDAACLANHRRVWRADRAVFLRKWNNV
jgi:GT2 family glycosyltransferase